MLPSGLCRVRQRGLEFHILQDLDLLSGIPQLRLAVTCSLNPLVSRDQPQGRMALASSYCSLRTCGRLPMGC